jgi:hypothetical protein
MTLLAPLYRIIDSSSIPAEEGLDTHQRPGPLLALGTPEHTTRVEYAEHYFNPLPHRTHICHRDDCLDMLYRHTL